MGSTDTLTLTQQWRWTQPSISLIGPNTKSNGLAIAFGILFFGCVCVDIYVFFHFESDKNRINRILLAKLILLTDEIPKTVNKNAVLWRMLRGGPVHFVLFILSVSMPFIFAFVCLNTASTETSHGCHLDSNSILLNARLNCWSTTQFSIAISRIQFVLMWFSLLSYVALYLFLVCYFMCMFVCVCLSSVTG